MAAKRRERRTVLRDLLPADVVVAPVEGEGKDEVLAKLLNALVIAGCLPLDKEQETLQAIRAREQVASTGIGNGVAIPHAKQKHIERHGLAVGVSRGGIEFAALDGQPVHVVFLSVCPPAATKEHLALMRAIAATAKDPDAVQRLSEARDRRGLLAVMQDLPVEDGKA